MTIAVESAPRRNAFVGALNRWMMILGKLPKLAVVLKMMKLGKLFAMVGTMIVSVVAYGLAYNSWIFGFGLVGLLLVHELGHVIAARRCGLSATWPIFLPFIGAAIFIKQFSSIRNEAYVAVAGPLIGSVGTLVLFVPYLLTGANIWRGLLFMGIVLNAFNLIPLRPLDGGRMTAICGRWFKVFGFGILALLSLAVHEPVMLYVWILVLSDIPFPLWWRTVTGVTLAIIMIGLMAFGFSHQPWWADLVDSLFASVMCLNYFLGEKEVAEGKPDPFRESYDDEVHVTLRERVLWATAWGVITSVLSVALWILASAPQF